MRFNRRGRTGVWLVSTLADPAEPTDDEIAAGVALHEVLAATNGFSSEQDDLPVPDAGSTWNGTIPGGETPEASSMTFYAGTANADAEETVRAALVEGDEAYVVFTKWAKTPTATNPADVFPVRVKAVNDEYNLGENSPARFVAGFSIYDSPSKHVDIVAAP